MYAFHLKASSKKQLPPSELALTYFDTFYKPVYGDMWPSIRLALLCKQKYTALLNNFSSKCSDNLVELASLGAQDMLDIAARTSYSKRHWKKIKDQEDNDKKLLNSAITDYSVYDSVSHTDVERVIVENESPEQTNTSISHDMNDFMPAQRVVSEHELIQAEEEYRGIFLPRDSDQLQIVPDVDLYFPKHLKAFCFDKGDISHFPAPPNDELQKLGIK